MGGNIISKLARAHLFTTVKWFQALLFRISNSIY